ncbi:MAG: hypothetical protein WC327_04405 [Candidatus Cloacimonadia bacterium]
MSSNLMKICNVMTWNEWLERQKARDVSYRSLEDYYYYLVYAIYLAMFSYPKEIILPLVDEIKNRYKGFVDMAEDLYPNEKVPKLLLKGNLDRAFTEYTKLYFEDMDIASLCDQLLVFLHHEPEIEGSESEEKEHRYKQTRKMLKIVIEDSEKDIKKPFNVEDEKELVYLISQVIVLKITIAVLKEKYKLGDTRNDMQETYDFMIEILKGTAEDGKYELIPLSAFMHVLESHCEISQHYILNLDLLFDRLLPYSTGNQIVKMIMTPNPFYQQVSSIKSPFKIYSSYIKECDRILSSDASDAVKGVAKKLKSKISRREKKDLEFPVEIPNPFTM